MQSKGRTFIVRGWILASSSTGNATLLATEKTRLLIDAGLSRKETFERLVRIGISPQSLTAILITHEHSDHLDPAAIQILRTTNTAVVLTAACAEKISGGIVMKNGDVETVKGVKLEAVPAYNIVHKRGDGTPNVSNTKSMRSLVSPQRAATAPGMPVRRLNSA